MPVGSWKTKHWDWIGGATVYIVNGSDRGGTTEDQKKFMRQWLLLIENLS